MSDNTDCSNVIPEQHWSKPSEGINGSRRSTSVVQICTSQRWPKPSGCQRDLRTTDSDQQHIWRPHEIRYEVVW